MAGSPKNIFVLLLVVVVAHKSMSFRRFNNLNKRPSSFQSSRTRKTAQTPQMSKKLYSFMRNVTSTDDFLRKMNLFNQTKQKGDLPSQIKSPLLKSRSSGGVGLQADMLDLDIQLCTVRPYIHFLEQPPRSELAFIWPHAVKIPRCIGSCSMHHDITKCVANNVYMIQLIAYRVPYDKSDESRKRRDVMEEFAKLKDPVHELSKRSASRVQVLTIPLELHRDCKCECAVTAQMCALENKVLNKDYCRCECPTVKKTPCKHPFRWSDNTCQCECGEDRYSSMRRCYVQSKRKKYWDHNQCDCLCKSSCPPKVHVRQFNTLDTNNCECKCAVSSCPGNQTLSIIGKSNICQCV